MGFWRISIILYLAAAIAGLGLPVISFLQGRTSLLLETTMGVLSVIILTGASFVFVLMVARRFFPDSWWRAQVCLEGNSRKQGHQDPGSHRPYQEYRSG